MSLRLSVVSLSSFAYLLVCVAKSDYHMSGEEEAFILEKLKKYSRNGQDTTAAYRQTLFVYEAHSKQDREYGIGRACLQLKEDISEQDRSVIIHTIEHLISVDEVVRDIEIAILQTIREKLM